jgi:hypothetical protein
MQLFPTLFTAYRGKLLGHTVSGNQSADSLHARYCNVTSNDLIKSSVNTQQVYESMQNELLQLNIETFQHVL